MSELPPELARLVAAEREAMVPSAAARARNLEGLRAALAEGRPPIVDVPPPSPASSGAASSSLGLVLGAVVLGAVVLGGAVWIGMAGDADEGGAPRSIAAVEPEPAVVDHERPSSSGAVSSPSASGSATSPASEPPGEPGPGEPVPGEPASGSPSSATPEPPTLGSPVASGRSTSRPSRKPDPGDARGGSSEPSAEDGFAAELRMLKQAKAAADQGRSAEALGLLDRAASRFGAGAFDEERRALRVRVLCALGRKAAGRDEAERFFRDYPASPQTERVRHACD